MTASSKVDADVSSPDWAELVNEEGRELMPKDEFQREFSKALAEAGYDSREKIIELVREVKREMYEERRRQDRFLGSRI